MNSKPNSTSSLASSVVFARAYSEIGLKWFLFAFFDSRMVFGFMSVSDFFGYLFFSNDRSYGGSLKYDLH